MNMITVVTKLHATNWEVLGRIGFKSPLGRLSVAKGVTDQVQSLTVGCYWGSGEQTQPASHYSCSK